MTKEKNSIKHCIDDDYIMATYPVMQQLRSVEENDYVFRIKELIFKGYHLYGSFNSKNICCGAIGYKIDDRLHTGKMIYIEDLVVDAQYRSFGHGRALLNWVESEAIRLNCKVLVLDSGVQRASAHKFYFNNKFTITSFNFKRDLDQEK